MTGLAGSLRWLGPGAALVGLLAANAVSLTGNALARVAIPWFVLQTRGSALDAGLAVAAETLPLALGGVFGGPLVDRLGHKRASVVADLASGGTVALVPLLHALDRLPFGALLALVFLGALADAPGGAARQALLPGLAGRACTPPERANAAAAAVFRLSILVGPALGGALIGLVGVAAVLWFDAASFAASAALVAAVVPAGRTRAAQRSAKGYRADLLEGVRFVRADRRLRGLVVAPALLSLFLSPIFYVAVPVWLDAAGRAAAELGLIFSAFGGGALLGAVGYGALGSRVAPRRLYLGCMAAAGGAAALAALPPLPVAAAASLLVGAAFGPIGPLVAVATQERTPPELRGRIFGVVSAVGQLATPAGVVLAGGLLAAVPVPGAIAILAGGGGLVALGEAVRPLLGATDEPPVRQAQSAAGRS